MPIDGAGNFTRSYNWVADKAGAIKINATRMDGEFDNYAAALNQAFWRSGVAAMTGSLNLGANSITGIADGSAAAPSNRFLNDTTTGIYLAAVGKLGVSAAGVKSLEITSSGTLILDGTLAAPSVRFMSDTNTGIYKSAAGKVAMAAGGVQSAEFASTGVNIPAALTVGTTLNVTGASTFTGGVTLGAPLPRASGGTGVGTAPTNGQILIGSTASGNYVPATLTAGVGITITNGANSVTIASAVGSFPAAGIAVSTGAAWAGSLAAPAGALVGTTDVQTQTNKRMTPRVVSSGSTTGAQTPTSDSADQYNMIGLTGAITVNAPSGTPTNGQKLIMLIADNGTSRGITWVTTSGGFAPYSIALPAATIAGKATYFGCIWNAATGFWDVVAQATKV